jgi:acyl-CoA hydrolase
VEHTNNPFVIAQNDNMIAINSALEVDLTGQVCSDSIGTYIYSGFGGQLDFIRGAAASKGGKPIIALPSTAKGNTMTRITPKLKEGSGVVTTRADVHYVVTEFGVANLWGKNLQERARSLISIAHPEFREMLEKEARDRHLIT